MKKYYVDKNLILGSIMRKVTVSQFCEDIKVDRAAFYRALDRAYRAPRSKIICRAAEKLGLLDSLIWREGE